MLDYDKHLQEPMDMPDPEFPIKVHTQRFHQEGVMLFPHHWHEHLEFIFIESGEAVFECGRTPINVRVGDLVAVNSNELHYGVSASSDLLYYAIIADTSLLHSAVSDAAETKFIAPIQRNQLLLRNHIRGISILLTVLWRLFGNWNVANLVTSWPSSPSYTAC